VTQEARISVEFLETPGLDGFHVLFMKSVPFDLKFDQLFWYVIYIYLFLISFFSQQFTTMPYFI